VNGVTRAVPRPVHGCLIWFVSSPVDGLRRVNTWR
jgi:hypothetical protein